MMARLVHLLLLTGIALPLRHLQLNSGYGYRIHPLTGKYSFHEGIDLAACHDTVYAMLPGKVRKAGYHPALGVYVVLDHGPYEVTCGHLSRLLVLPEDSVRQGEAVAITGNTGRVTGEHLHISIRFKDHLINPLAFLYAALINPKYHE